MVALLQVWWMSSRRWGPSAPSLSLPWLRLPLLTASSPLTRSSSRCGRASGSTEERYVNEIRPNRVSLSWRTHEILHLCQNNLVQLNEPLTVYYIIFFAWKNVECVKCASFFPRVSLLFSKPSATWSHWWTLSTPTTTPGRWCWSWSESSSLPTRRWRRSCWRWTNSELPQTLGV